MQTEGKLLLPPGYEQRASHATYKHVCKRDRRTTNFSSNRHNSGSIRVSWAQPSIGRLSHEQ